MSRIINLKGRATEEARKAKMLGLKVSRRATNVMPTTSRNDIDEDDDDDEYQDELFEEVDVAANTSSNHKNVPSSSKLPPLQRIFPLSFEPSMIEDATYSGPKIDGNE